MLLQVSHNHNNQAKRVKVVNLYVISSWRIRLKRSRSLNQQTSVSGDTEMHKTQVSCSFIRTQLMLNNTSRLIWPYSNKMTWNHNKVAPQELQDGDLLKVQTNRASFIRQVQESSWNSSSGHNRKRKIKLSISDIKVKSEWRCNFHIILHHHILLLFTFYAASKLFFYFRKEVIRESSSSWLKY